MSERERRRTGQKVRWAQIVGPAIVLIICVLQAAEMDADGFCEA